MEFLNTTVISMGEMLRGQSSLNVSNHATEQTDALLIKTARPTNQRTQEADINSPTLWMRKLSSSDINWSEVMKIIIETERL